MPGGRWAATAELVRRGTSWMGSRHTAPQTPTALSNEHASADAIRAVPGLRARSSPGSAAGTVGGPAARHAGRDRAGDGGSEPFGRRRSPPEAARLIYSENNSAAPPCKCSASCHVDCIALATLHSRLSTLHELYLVDVFSVTDSVTKIHVNVHCGSTQVRPCPCRSSQPRDPGDVA